MEETIRMAHGSGGEASARLIREVFAAAFENEYLREMEDASVVPAGGHIAMTTDSYVVTPAVFSGGDIGRLAVCGTVNDLLTCGARPRYLTAGFILAEGYPLDSLRQIVNSMAETAREAGVLIVTGDTKVIEGGISGGIMINTAGVGIAEEDFRPHAKNIAPGDSILISGALGDHHAAILAERMELSNASIKSDAAPLTEMVQKLREAGIEIHAMRDVTRGGLATVLNEWSNSSGFCAELWEECLPVHAAVRDFCGILGLDPLYMGNEGKMLFAVPEQDAERALGVIRASRYGQEAVCVGKIADAAEEPLLTLRTKLGGMRVIGPLFGEGLPRIC